MFRFLAKRAKARFEKEESKLKKRVTRLLALFLTLVMFLSVTTPAFAWGGDIGIGGGLDREIGEDDLRDFEGEPDPDAEDPYDYFAAYDAESGISVTVESPNGALPRLAEVRVEPVSAEDVREAVYSVVDGNPTILVAMDISFWLDGIEIEPDEPVRVKIAAPELENKSNLTVVHIPDTAEPEMVQLIPEEDLQFSLGTNEIAFMADSFSTYAIT